MYAAIKQPAEGGVDELHSIVFDFLRLVSVWL